MFFNLEKKVKKFRISILRTEGKVCNWCDFASNSQKLIGYLFWIFNCFQIFNFVQMCLISGFQKVFPNSSFSPILTHFSVLFILPFLSNFFFSVFCRKSRFRMTHSTSTTSAMKSTWTR